MVNSAQLSLRGEAKHGISAGLYIGGNEGGVLSGGSLLWSLVVG